MFITHGFDRIALPELIEKLQAWGGSSDARLHEYVNHDWPAAQRVLLGRCDYGRIPPVRRRGRTGSRLQVSAKESLLHSRHPAPSGCGSLVPWSNWSLLPPPIDPLLAPLTVPCPWSLLPVPESPPEFHKNHPPTGFIANWRMASSGARRMGIGWPCPLPMIGALEKAL